mmetsp:Transcript_30461/g.83484  ORF Transcript_30461/g.83484 Transcript_30461/m.83484 type:complete len:127 (+) Transcript_30461:157-537(+)
MSLEDYKKVMGEMDGLDAEVKAHEKSLPQGEDTADEKDDDDEGGDEMGAKLAGWEKRKEKYKKYIDKGKVDKLEKACDKQKAKLEKAKSKGKSEAYIAYKAAKVEWTQKAIKAAELVLSLKKSGLM